MTADLPHRYNHTHLMKASAVSLRSSTASDYSRTSTSDWLRKSRGLRGEHVAINLFVYKCQCRDALQTRALSLYPSVGGCG